MHNYNKHFVLLLLLLTAQSPMLLSVQEDPSNYLAGCAPLVNDFDLLFSPQVNAVVEHRTFAVKKPSRIQELLRKIGIPIAMRLAALKKYLQRAKISVQQWFARVWGHRHAKA